MNISGVSEYENNASVPFETNNGDVEAVGMIINDILKLLDTSQPVTYCPFCVSSFPNNLTLTNHLRSTHSVFLWELTNRSISLDACPLCSAKFVGHHLVAKHALMFHGNVLVDAYFEKCGSTVKCAFCHSVVIFKNVLAHLEEWHALQFIEWFTSKFQIRQEGVSGLVETQCVRVDIDDLNEHLQNLQVMSTPKSILKTPDRKVLKPPVRRGLSFADEDKENQVGKKLKTPKGAWALRSSSIQCGKCALMFPNIKQLDFHIKNDHKKTPGNMLQRFYKCSQCGANFFKRSYLRKHVARHTLTKFR